MHFLSEGLGQVTREKVHHVNEFGCSSKQECQLKDLKSNNSRQFSTRRTQGGRYCGYLFEVINQWVRARAT